MIRIENITIGYGTKRLIEGVSAHFPKGEIIALIGRNGSGKSTLLRSIVGLCPLIEGEIIIKGEKLKDLSHTKLSEIVSFVTTEKVRINHLTCHDLVAMGRAPYTNWIGSLTPQDEEIIDHSLHLVGMESYRDRELDKMSDGECQRVMIARALAQETPIILLDEPTSFLDMPNRYDLCHLLSELAHKEGKTILFSTHELDIAISLCDSIALIENPTLHLCSAQKMVESGIIERLFSSSKHSFNPIKSYQNGYGKEL